MKLKMSLRQAEERAGKVIDLLTPVCERVEVAGSIRRRRVEVGDVEIVAIPVMSPVLDMFGTQVGMASMVDEVLAKLQPKTIKAGEHYKQLVIDGWSLDLFLCNHETWGVIFTIRTGNADFSKWIVTDRQHGGAMPSDMRCRDGRLWRGGKALETPGERDVFEALGVAWVDPQDRTGGQWARLPSRFSGAQIGHLTKS